MLDEEVADAASSLLLLLSLLLLFLLFLLLLVFPTNEMSLPRAPTDTAGRTTSLQDVVSCQRSWQRIRSRGKHRQQLLSFHQQQQQH